MKINNLKINLDVFKNNNGNKVRLSDTLNDDSNIVVDYEEKELRDIVRELIEKLPNRDREIIKLYFGFYNDRIYRQREISSLLGISQAFVSKIILKHLNSFKDILIKRNIIEGDLIINYKIKGR